MPSVCSPRPMPQPDRCADTLRAARFVAVGGVLLFWLGVVLADAFVDGYAARADYISSLASRGSPVASLGIGALLASAVAHAATAGAVFTAWRSRLGAACIGAAAVATTVVAIFRTSCPSGPAGCALTDSQAGDWIDSAHAAGVVAYEVFLLVAMLTLAVPAVRASLQLPRPALGLASLIFAVMSVVLIGQIAGEHAGMWQRLWLASNLGWLLLVAWVATKNPRNLGQS